MKDKILDRLASVKSVVTALLAGVFGYLAVTLAGLDFSVDMLRVFVMHECMGLYQ